MGTLPTSIMALVVAIIILVIGVVILQEIRDVDTIANTNSLGCNATDHTQCGPAYEAANASTIAIGDFSDFVPIIVIALAASIVIGLILLGFALRRTQR